MRSSLVLALVVLAVAVDCGAQSLGSRQVRVSIEFRDTGTTDTDVLDGSGRIVITERGAQRSAGSLGATSRTTRTTRSSGIFTIVQDGGESRLLVASRVPYEDVRFYRDYLTGAGYVARGVFFENVGTSLKVHADVFGSRIRLRLVPTVSYLSTDGSGTIDVTDAATELEVESGKPVVIGGGTTDSNEITRRILGYRATTTRRESSMLLTAVIQ
jgi:Bacterial type II and III secretion system protein